MSSFTEVYKTALSPFIQKYADAKNEKVRKVVISDAVAAIHETRENQEDKADLAKDLPKVCFIIFHSHSLTHLIFSRLSKNFLNQL